MKSKPLPTDLSKAQKELFEELDGAGIVDPNVEKISDLLVTGLDVNCTDRESTDRETPLMKAAEGGYEDIVKLLLERGADVMMRDEDGDTALVYAVEEGHDSIVKILIDHGDRSYKDNLQLAAAIGDEDTVRNLLPHCSDVNVGKRVEGEPLYWAARISPINSRLPSPDSDRDHLPKSPVLYSRSPALKGLAMNFSRVNSSRFK